MREKAIIVTLLPYFLFVYFIMFLFSSSSFSLLLFSLVFVVSQLFHSHDKEVKGTEQPITVVGV